MFDRHSFSTRKGYSTSDASALELLFLDVLFAVDKHCVNFDLINLCTGRSQDKKLFFALVLTKRRLGPSSMTEEEGDVEHDTTLAYERGGELNNGGFLKFGLIT